MTSELRGLLVVTSVDPVTGEERASGELMPAGARAMPLWASRGDSLTARAPELVESLAARLAALDREHGRPVRVRIELAEGGVMREEAVEPATLSALGLARVIAERCAAARVERDAALAWITRADAEGMGTIALAAAPPPAHARGLGASPGCAAGRLALPHDVLAASDGEARIVVVDDASAEDAAAIRAAAAIVATSGGLTADAAIAARALRKPCVVSAPLRLGEPGGPARGDWVTVDGGRGEVYLGALATTWTPGSPHVAEIARWITLGAGESLAAALARRENSAQAG